ncbi:MAG: dihydroorotate dehydrogenase-like protein [Gammaproteobacteria bacterium]|jgi:dihydroorotate dehydrogenase (fumarate)
MKLTTRYMGLELAHPVVASASPLSRTLDGVKRLEDAGAAAIVIYSLFEEQIRHEAAAQDHLLDAGSESFGEALSYFPDLDGAEIGPQQYLEHIRRCREAVSIPVIASLNGASPEGWTDYAGLIEEAGAHALELNLYYLPAVLEESGADIERRYLQTVHRVRETVSLPLAVKVGPWFSAFGHMALQFERAGADALVLFNRFYQPDFDIEKLEVAATLELSRPNEIRQGLFWLSLLHGRIKASLAATSGVASAAEVAKYLLAGADVVMSASAILRHGPSEVSALRDGLVRWMDERGYEDVDQVRGAMSRGRVADPEAFERSNYLRVLDSYQSRWG